MTIEEYRRTVPQNQLEYFSKLEKVIAENIPNGFEEVINYNMIGFVVPHSLYPAGYHCDPKSPLPFINIGVQKKSITMYHLGLYSNSEITNWFIAEYSKLYSHKIDMGKSCIRFKYYNEIPFELIR